jgi:hypothetical protein
MKAGRGHPVKDGPGCAWGTLEGLDAALEPGPVVCVLLAIGAAIAIGIKLRRDAATERGR